MINGNVSIKPTCNVIQSKFHVDTNISKYNLLLCTEFPCSNFLLSYLNLNSQHTMTSWWYCTAFIYVNYRFDYAFINTLLFSVFNCLSAKSGNLCIHYLTKNASASGSPNISNWEIILIVVVNFNGHGHEIEYVEQQFPFFIERLVIK